MTRRRRAVRLALLVLLGSGAAYGLAYLVVLVASLRPPAVYNKDFVQEFLLARAFADPARPDPYAPIRELAERYLGVVGYGGKEYPTPHPPPVGVLFMPLTLVDYPTAAALWLGVQLASLSGAISLLARAQATRLGLPWVGGLAVVAIGWHPVHLDLGLGQLMVVMLALLAGARLALLRGRPVLAGVLLGVAILVKVIPWPLVLLLALRRAWRATAASVATVLVGYVLVGLAVGFDTVVEYVLRIAPLLTSYFRDDPANQSLWTLGPRVLRILDGEHAGPGGVVAAAVVPGLVLLAALAWARSRLDLDAALGVVLCASLLVSPIAWEMYLVLAAIPAAQLGSELMRRPSRVRIAGVALVGLLLLVEWDQWLELGRLVEWLPGSALLSLGPAVAMVVLGCSLAMLARRPMGGGAATRWAGPATRRSSTEV